MSTLDRERVDQASEGNTRLSYERQGWVIPNGHGQLWTDRIFDTEAAAKACVAEVWREWGLSGTQHQPAFATVRLSALLAHQGAPDAR